jgi:Zn-dependent protease
LPKSLGQAATHLRRRDVAKVVNYARADSKRKQYSLGLENLCMETPHDPLADQPLSYYPIPSSITTTVQPLPVLGELPREPRQPAPPQYRRRVLLPVLLIAATCLSTFWAGSGPEILSQRVLLHGGETTAFTVVGIWHDGLVYMLGVMAILLAHEMGHFVQAVRYGVPASLPFFIPMPFTPIGTMGAVISMRGSGADRKELFDIGLTGPLAGLLVAIPLLWIGIQQAPAFPMNIQMPTTHFEDPLLMKWMMSYLRPNLAPGQELALTPLLRAGWFGLLLTGLNMLPISQLDGGHVSYALFGRGSFWLARGVLLAAFAFIYFAEAYGWMVMLLLVMLIGIQHPPTANDRAPMSWGRRALGLASLAIPILCMTPNPISVK